MILDGVFYCFIPFLITLAFSNLTLIKLIKNKKQNKSSTNTDSKTTNNTINRNQILPPKNMENNKNKVKINDPDSRVLKAKIKRSKKTKTSNINTVVFKNLKIEFFNGNPISLQNSTIIQREAKISQTDQEQTMSIKNENLVKFKTPLVLGKRTSGFKTTIMLMTLPISYLISTFPVIVIISMQFVNNVIRDEVENDYETEFAFSKCIMYLNNSFNILFFMLFGESVRNDLKKYFSRK